MLSLDIDTTTLEFLFDQEVECGVHYKDCTQAAVWRADGQCPQCSEVSRNRTICQACFEQINSGARMQHPKCGYRGLGIDFFDKFEKL